MKTDKQLRYNLKTFMSSLNRRYACSLWVATALQSAIAILFLWLSRIPFYIINGHGGTAFATPLWKLMLLGIPFDLTAWAYFNALFIVMRFLPAPFTMRRWWLIATNAVWMVCNGLLLLINLGDAAYFPFQGARMRFPAFKELAADPGMYGVAASYIGTYWWAFLLVFGTIALMFWLFLRIRPVRIPLAAKTPLRRWGGRVGMFLLMAGVVVLCMRGRLSTVGRALKPVDAMAGIVSMADQNVVLNTPFNIIHTLKDIPFEVHTYFSADELARIRSSYFVPTDSTAPMLRRNVMLIIIESGGQFWIDGLDNARNPKPRGLMPFTDSIASRSKVIKYNFATGRRSNEGLAAILGGFTLFAPHSLMGSPFQAQNFDAFPALLQREGYSTRYYSGCNARSLAMDQMAKLMGMQKVVDRDTYGNDADYDGVWGISDHAMGAYAARDLSALPQPWLGVWFTLSTHAPFKIPEGWDGGVRYKTPAGSMERAMEYEDRALRNFFSIARTQPWYKNTIFVITADHGCRDMRGTIYDNAWLCPSIPMIIYDPSGEVVQPGVVTDRVMSQGDTGATIMGLLRYPHRFVQMGRDVLNLPSDEPHYAIYKETALYNIISNRYVVQWDGVNDRPVAMYDVQTDEALAHPFVPRSGTPQAKEAAAMIRYAKAYLQDFTHRLTESRLTE